MAAIVALAVFFQPMGYAQQPWPLWEAYANRFIDGQGRVIDRSSDDRTTSEGQAYAMFFALVANDRTRFDKLLNWTEANLAGGDLTLRLPAWDWGKSPQGDWKILDDNSASDADLWMAYTLLQAGALWHGERYTKLGELMATRIAQQEVATIPRLGITLLPGPHGFHPDAKTWFLNPSYLPLPVLAYLAKTIPHGPWAAILRSTPAVIGQGAGAGYAIDWVSASASGVHPATAPAQPASGVREPQPAGSYDAIRVYLWLGIADPETPGAHDLLKRLPGMALYLRTAVTPPLEVDASGHIVRPDAPPGFSAAVAPYLLAAGLKAHESAQIDRLTATRDTASGLYGRAGAYYDQNLALFSTGFLDHRYRFDRDGRLKTMWK